MTLNPTFCRPFLANNCPFGKNCSLRHDIFQCSCGRALPLLNRKAHMKGKAHKKALLELESTGNTFATPNAGSSGGRRNVPSGSLDERYAENSQPQSPVQERLVCEFCQKSIENAEYDAHIENHIRQQRLDTARAELDEAKNDKEGVTVTGRNGVHFGVLGEDRAVETFISVTSASAAVSLKRCKISSSNRQDEHGVKFSAHLRGQKGRVIQKGETKQVAVVFHPSYAGQFEDTLVLIFFHLEKRSTFVITRSLEAIVGSQEDHEQLKAKAPYIRRKITRLSPAGKIVRSLRPPTWTKTPWKDRLLMFYPPASLIDKAFNERSPSLSQVKNFMPPVFNEKTYGAWFQIPLYLEEHQVKLDLDAYSMLDVELEADYPRYRLMVQGLSENRPSVLVGDFILVSPAAGPDSETFHDRDRTWFEGRVHQVLQSHVTLHLGDKFNTYRGAKFDVRFVLNRLPFRRMHQALVNKFNPPRLLFPGPTHIQGLKRIDASKIEEIVPAYRPLGEDEEQMETVAAIVNQAPGSVPFIVFGPPGTGKTITIVEAMNQILDRDPDARILACAPNNSAADLMALKLQNRGKSQIYRLNALTRKLSDLPKSLREFSSINDNTVFAMPPSHILAKCRVVVSTCLSAGVPASLGLKRGHFTHIFIDEAGQGKEPEVMIPIKSIADEKTNVILAGDNQQLGPVINSSLAGGLGLRTSYLSRLMQCEIYDLKKYRGMTIVKLVKNFRSHPDILRFSNEHFYNSELISCGNPALIHSLENNEELPKKSFPVMFHSIIGRDEREKQSPSFFNIDEASQVKKYCLSLINSRKNQIKAEHIGVITPYHAQRCKILDLLYREFKLRDIKVGSVEEFQGQERRVIIISTVRSNTDFVKSDIRRSLGFVANKSRLNVALTRAQAMLIVIGNPIVLSLDPLWRSFLNYVHNRGGWKGKAIDWDPLEPVTMDAPYDAQRKSRAEAEMEDNLDKLRAMVIQQHLDDGLELDDEDQEAASFERPILREAE